MTDYLQSSDDGTSNAPSLRECLNKRRLQVVVMSPNTAAAAAAAAAATGSSASSASSPSSPSGSSGSESHSALHQQMHDIESEEPREPSSHRHRKLLLEQVTDDGDPTINTNIPDAGAGAGADGQPPRSDPTTTASPRSVNPRVAARSRKRHIENVRVSRRQSSPLTVGISIAPESGSGSGSGSFSQNLRTSAAPLQSLQSHNRQQHRQQQQQQQQQHQLTPPSPVMHTSDKGRLSISTDVEEPDLTAHSRAGAGGSAERNVEHNNSQNNLLSYGPSVIEEDQDGLNDRAAGMPSLPLPGSLLLSSPGAFALRPIDPDHDELVMERSNSILPSEAAAQQRKKSYDPTNALFDNSNHRGLAEQHPSSLPPIAAQLVEEDSDARELEERLRQEFEERFERMARMSAALSNTVQAQIVPVVLDDSDKIDPVEDHEKRGLDDRRRRRAIWIAALCCSLVLIAAAVGTAMTLTMDKPSNQSQVSESKQFVENEGGTVTRRPSESPSIPLFSTNSESPVSSDLDNTVAPAVFLETSVPSWNVSTDKPTSVNGDDSNVGATTDTPIESPAKLPTLVPTFRLAPTTWSPSPGPTNSRTALPTRPPTRSPVSPTTAPQATPIPSPTPIRSPTLAPAPQPTPVPVPVPLTPNPTPSPTRAPTIGPTGTTSSPTFRPTPRPTSVPSVAPVDTGGGGSPTANNPPTTVWNGLTCLCYYYHQEIVLMDTSMQDSLDGEQLGVLIDIILAQIKSSNPYPFDRKRLVTTINNPPRRALIPNQWQYFLSLDATTWIPPNRIGLSYQVELCLDDGSFVTDYHDAFVEYFTSQQRDAMVTSIQQISGLVSANEVSTPSRQNGRACTLE